MPGSRRTVFLSIIFLIALLFGSGQPQAEPARAPHKGLNLVGEFVVAEGREASDRVVLVLHGTLAHLNMDTIKGLRDVLTERGYNSLSINLSFDLDNRTGPYDCAIPHRHRYGDAVAELTIWLDWLSRKGVKDVTLLGHSRGGAQVALFGASADHDLVKRLVLLAPATWDEDKSRAGYKKTHGKALSTVIASARALSSAGKGGELMKGAGLLYCPGTDVTADSFLSYYEPNPNLDTPTLLPKIKLPTLVIAGGEDKVVPDVADKTRPLANGGNIRLAVVDDAGHFFLDLYAEDVVDLVENFMGTEE
ncbi:MAG: alpha/beta hydrolase [Rhodospirillaceae bacterium]|jgi:pimeloyl-ACP methyl ester carboxylesterase|nr:alpha/beta hydrolase [Rhodospirillaceae bacterium]MBT6138579.1 alpha/beta hydrolase [Rhodospirillaceae bacterium]